MNIKTMTDEQKSAMLTRLMGWVYETGDYRPERAWAYDSELTGFAEVDDCIQYHFKPQYVTPNIYDPSDMRLAWMVLNWAMPNKDLDRWWVAVGIYNKPPAEAQRLWLDKVLELAIEAGLVEVA